MLGWPSYGFEDMRDVSFKCFSLPDDVLFRERSHEPQVTREWWGDPETWLKWLRSGL
jgi:hypothetical protein